ncbi:hypothetical protein [Roseobacter sp.]|uniref:hypothetical protein n=1 Tax=Roseobacter sp. TaxID=1907202 RepID=UPI002966A198|nr:hypothetical protein [Roseobacter sp.]MDW3180464.1 hypothetical protein [Roseobacter sp.]
MDGIVDIYAQDSFFTLSFVGQVGLVLVSVMLAAGTVFLAWRLSRVRSLILRACVAVVLFGAFVWISPQVYYGYYLLIFDGLPLQWVIQDPPSPLFLVKLLAFSVKSDLSHHGQGLLGWLCLGAALWPQRDASRLGE